LFQTRFPHNQNELTQLGIAVCVAFSHVQVRLEEGKDTLYYIKRKKIARGQQSSSRNIPFANLKLERVTNEKRTATTEEPNSEKKLILMATINVTRRGILLP
jgi:hypothetical protein